jgi:hypothetical protein
MAPINQEEQDKSPDRYLKVRIDNDQLQKSGKNLASISVEEALGEAVVSIHTDKKDPEVGVLVIGHSFVSRFRRYVKDIARDNKTTKQDVMGLSEDKVVPWFKGQGGAFIDDLSQMARELIDNPKTPNEGKLPNIIMVEIGQNDICMKGKTPVEIATELVREAKKLLLDFPTAKLMVICQVTIKTEKIYESNQHKYTDKTLDELNEDIRQLNHEVYKLKGMTDNF